MEVKCVDDSVLKVTLLDEFLELQSSYGTLRIPAREVKTITVGVRLPDAAEREIEAAVADLRGTAPRPREAAKQVLLRHGAKAAPYVRRAAVGAPPEAVDHLRDLLARLATRNDDGSPADEPSLNDVVRTDDSRFAGRLAAPTLRVATLQFGEQKLRLADVRQVAAIGPDDDKLVGPVVDAPANMFEFQNRIGQTFLMRVTGVANGSLWGTDAYTLDSSPALAAIHAGLVKPGQTAVVRVRMVPDKGSYTGSLQNGVTSGGWGPFPSGAFEFVVKKK